MYQKSKKRREALAVIEEAHPPQNHKRDDENPKFCIDKEEAQAQDQKNNTSGVRDFGTFEPISFWKIQQLPGGEKMDRKARGTRSKH